MASFISFLRALLVLFSVFASGARLASVRQLSGRFSESNVSASNLGIWSALGPPLEGCQENLFRTTCCCFIDAGILQQESCECTDDPSTCVNKIRTSYKMHPSRVLPADYAPQWLQPAGYIKGYRAVSDDYCMAAPVLAVDVDPHERSFECACSTDMGAITEMSCGSGCNVVDCERTNKKLLDWTPFRMARGKCCLSSYNSATKGCEQEVQPLTESGARHILSDALKHATRGEQTAFVLTPELVDDMTKSFETAKQKKLSTSRSGADFFFSGDYGYILKSIHRPEYKTLHQLTQPHDDKRKRNLIEHVAWNRQQAASMKAIENCLYLQVEKREITATTENPSLSEADVLAKVFFEHAYKFSDIWRFDEQRNIDAGLRSFTNMVGTYKAVWCDAVSEYRIMDALDRYDFSGCADLENDLLYQSLLKTKTKKKLVGVTHDDILEVHADFVKVFVDALGVEGKQLKYVSGCCKRKWFPSSLINDFVIAFEYKSSTWMVVRNSVTAVRQELERHKFTSFHKEYDMFDVKPFPIRSDQRELLFAMQFTKSPMKGWDNWGSVRRNLFNDVKFMDHILKDPMVDYSLLVSAFFVDDARMVLDHATPPNCVEEKLSLISTQRPYVFADYGNAKGSILVCFSVIDMLMEFTLAKTPENLLLSNKWSNWGDKIMTMFDCLGDIDRDKGCERYRELRSGFPGVDIPQFMSAEAPLAFVQDVTDLIDADGEMKVVNSSQRSDAASDITYKCCCTSQRGGGCTMVETTGKSKKWSLIWGNPSGCGKLLGGDWHSFWRYAGRCMVLQEEAEERRNEVVYVDGLLKWNL